MSYLVLARKFRPQTFASIVGQEHITKALANAILWNRVPHALLLTGPRGVGKTTSARVFARALNCIGRPLPENAGPVAEQNAAAIVEPCGECVNCKEIARSASMAVWEIDGASNNSVENVRDLIDSLRSLPPPGSKYKIYIIDEVHMLSTAAFNALLKSLEEPPPNTIFIFATTEPHKIPETVISRCQRHDFRRISTTVISDTLKQLAAAESVEADEEVFEFVALKARGGMRDAQTMFDRLISFCGKQLNIAQAQQLFGVVDSAFFFRLSEAVFEQNTERCFLLLDEVFQQSLDIRSFVGDFITHFRNLFLLTTAKGSVRVGEESKIARILEVTKRDFQELSKQAASAESFDLQRLFEIAERTAESALSSSFPRFVFEAGIAKMAALPSLRPIADIIRELEKGGSPSSALKNSGGTHGGAISSRPAAAIASEPRPMSATPQVSVAPQEAAVPTASERTPKVEAAETAPASATAAGFNPSWQDFIAYVKGTRSEHVLAAFLRRVIPQTFVNGRLVLEGGAFDIEALKDPPTNNSLKICLAGYSEGSSWEVRFVLHEANAAQKPGSAAAPAAPLGKSIEKKRAASAPPGSLVALEAEAQRKRLKEIDGEARQDPLVKAALSMFEGASIEKVSPLKSEE